jgi:hypothetical protein
LAKKYPDSLLFSMRGFYTISEKLEDRVSSDWIAWNAILSARDGAFGAGK